MEREFTIANATCPFSDETLEHLRNFISSCSIAVVASTDRPSRDFLPCFMKPKKKARRTMRKVEILYTSGGNLTTFLWLNGVFLAVWSKINILKGMEVLERGEKKISFCQTWENVFSYPLYKWLFSISSFLIYRAWVAIRRLSKRWDSLRQKS